METTDLFENFIPNLYFRIFGAGAYAVGTWYMIVII
jgi:hypothetical protein